MPYHGEWYIPYRVIDVRFSGKMTWEDADQFTAQSATFLTEAQEHEPGKLTYLIANALELESMPPVYLMISRAMPILRFKNRGPMFLIVKKSTIRSILELTAHVMHFQLLIFSTRQEALAALEAVMLKDGIRSNV